MQTITELVNKLGVPISVAVLLVVVAVLWAASERRRDAQDKMMKEINEFGRQQWIEAVNGFTRSQERMADQFTASLREIASELRAERTAAPRRRK